MIVNKFSPQQGFCSLTAESAEDLWTLRRLIAPGDVLVTRSSRVVKNETEYSRPDKGERVRVTVALKVLEIHLDASVERLRVRGTIVEASDEAVTKSGSHSVSVSVGHPLTVRKERWTRADVDLVESTRGSSLRYLMVAMDRRDAGIGRLAGSHLEVLTTIESGLGGKMSKEQSIEPFIAKVAEFLKGVAGEGELVVLAGPGNVKNVLANRLARESPAIRVQLLEGFDLTGSDGIRALVKSPGFQKVAQGSLVVEMQRMVAEAVQRLARGDSKVAYTLPRVAAAAQAGAVESCAVSDDVFSSNLDEDLLVQTLNAVEERRGRVYLADSSLEFGKQVSAFGGIVALLRYPLRP